MVADRKALRWTPVERGDMYCSPACGFGCTRAEHNEAQRRAATLVAALGDGWTPRVWEYLGWHYAAVAAGGAIDVRPLRGRGYCAHLDRWHADGNAPAEAVSRVVAIAKAEVARVCGLIEAIGL
jgi:hypothetical protein